MLHKLNVGYIDLLDHYAARSLVYLAVVIFGVTATADSHGIAWLSLVYVEKSLPWYDPWKHPCRCRRAWKIAICFDGNTVQIEGSVIARRAAVNCWASVDSGIAATVKYHAFHVTGWKGDMADRWPICKNKMLHMILCRTGSCSGHV